MPATAPTYTTLEVAIDMAALCGVSEGIKLPLEVVKRIHAFAELSELLVRSEENTISPEMVIEAVLSKYGM